MIEIHRQLHLLLHRKIHVHQSELAIGIPWTHANAKICNPNPFRSRSRTAAAGRVDRPRLGPAKLDLHCLHRVGGTGRWRSLRHPSCCTAFGEDRTGFMCNYSREAYRAGRASQSDPTGFPMSGRTAHDLVDSTASARATRHTSLLSSILSSDLGMVRN